MHLVLASASPRRADLLRAAGFTFEMLAVDVDERVRPEESPRDYVRRLSMEKSTRAQVLIGPAEAGHCREGSQVHPRETQANVGSAFSRAGDEPLIIVAADTAVVVDGEILGKPREDVDAAGMLRRLSGRWHEVMTGVSVRSRALEVGRVEVTAVEFADLSPADIGWYVASGEGRDKAGAYAIQGLASRFIPRIAGSYSNVVGLPVACVAELLRQVGSS